MITVNYIKWNESPEFFRKAAMESSHHRSRERFLALYEITQGKSATRVAFESGRDPQTVMIWVRGYNLNGSSSLGYQKTGGRVSSLKKREFDRSIHSGSALTSR